MSDVTAAAAWMQAQIDAAGDLYQQDVVDYLVRIGQEDLLRENAEGSLVLGKLLLDAFRKLNAKTVVWVKRERYWRSRTEYDGPGRAVDD